MELGDEMLGSLQNTLHCMYSQMVNKKVAQKESVNSQNNHFKSGFHCIAHTVCLANSFFLKVGTWRIHLIPTRICICNWKTLYLAVKSQLEWLLVIHVGLIIGKENMNLNPYIWDWNWFFFLRCRKTDLMSNGCWKNVEFKIDWRDSLPSMGNQID